MPRFLVLAGCLLLSVGAAHAEQHGNIVCLDFLQQQPQCNWSLVFESRPLKPNSGLRSASKG